MRRSLFLVVICYMFYGDHVDAADREAALRKFVDAAMDGHAQVVKDMFAEMQDNVNASIETRWKEDDVEITHSLNVLEGALWGGEENIKLIEWLLAQKSIDVNDQKNR